MDFMATLGARSGVSTIESLRDGARRVLVLQGGGALGAHQAGVYEELSKTPYRPAPDRRRVARAAPRVAAYVKTPSAPRARRAAGVLAIAAR